ncbi:hypothetical protein L1049_021852 [Liquidambar formosana]|uniref:Protein kinase domain-containing protein n=1 Tax=Liquidambar formosana TaxID=63359 RepID=A0AAP0RDI4_LIQFO
MSSTQQSFEFSDWNGNAQSPPSPEDQFNSAVRWITAASIISGVVAAVAIVAIVLALIDCLKKAGSAIPVYARIATSTDDTTKKASEPPPHSSNDDDDVFISVPIPPVFPVIPDSQVQRATMERFLSNIAKERPIRFSPQQLARFTQDYSTLLGVGGFGVVYKGELPNGVQVAVKVLNNNYSDKRVEQQFMAEVGTLGRTYHMNLVRLFGFCFDPKMGALVYEYMKNGSLDGFLFNENQAIEWEKLHQIAISTAKGITYLHEECQQRIIHYDIKPGNVLLDENLNAKVADFGLAKLCNRESTHVVMTGCRGTPGYAAPELWKPYPVTHKCDVYSFGMLLFEIVGRRRNHDANLTESQQWLPRWIWEKFEMNDLAEMVSLCGIEEKDREKAERMCRVALWCVQHLPDARPLMSTVVKMLEGATEIASPPNPFEYLESFGPNLALHNGSNGESNSSASGTKTSESFNSNLVHNTFEIELAS